MKLNQLNQTKPNVGVYAQEKEGETTLFCVLCVCCVCILCTAPSLVCVLLCTAYARFARACARQLSLSHTTPTLMPALLLCVRGNSRSRARALSLSHTHSLTQSHTHTQERERERERERKRKKERERERKRQRERERHTHTHGLALLPPVTVL